MSLKFWGSSLVFRWKLWSVSYCMILLLSAATATATAAEDPTASPLISPTIPYELPPLPPPTEIQLKRGRELLEKILYVVDNVPLTNAAEALKVFGFEELITYEHPTNTRVVPRAKSGGTATVADLVGSGFGSIDVTQVYLASESNRVSASLGGNFSVEEACVSMEDVRTLFAPRAQSISTSRIMDIHPVLRPKPVNDVGRYAFLLSSNPFRSQTSAMFRFEYQRCAKAFTFNYFFGEEFKQ